MGEMELTPNATLSPPEWSIRMSPLPPPFFFLRVCFTSLKKKKKSQDSVHKRDHNLFWEIESNSNPSLPVGRLTTGPNWLCVCVLGGVQTF